MKGNRKNTANRIKQSNTKQKTSHNSSSLKKHPENSFDLNSSTSRGPNGRIQNSTKKANRRVRFQMESNKRRSHLKMSTTSSIFYSPTAREDVPLSTDVMASATQIECLLQYRRKIIQTHLLPCRKPTFFIRYWLWWPLVFTTKTYLLSFLVRNYDKLSDWLSIGVENVQDFFLSHVREPTVAMIKEVLLREREYITDMEALQDTKISLIRMLDAFIKDTHPEIKPKLRKEMAEKMDMSVVSRAYESSLPQAVMNVITGDVVRIMLIQVQFIKKELLVAMSAIDELMDTNQFNFRLTALFPAVLLAYLSYSLVRSGYHRLRQKKSTHQNAELLRSHLLGIERVLNLRNVMVQDTEGNSNHNRLFDLPDKSRYYDNGNDYYKNMDSTKGRLVFSNHSMPGLPPQGMVNSSRSFASNPYMTEYSLVDNQQMIGKVKQHDDKQPNLINPTSIPNSPLVHTGRSRQLTMNSPCSSNIRFLDEEMIDDLSVIGEGGLPSQRHDNNTAVNIRNSFYQRGLRHQSTLDIGGEMTKTDFGRPRNVSKASAIFGQAPIDDSFDIVDKQDLRGKNREVTNNNRQYMDYTGGIFLKSNDLGLVLLFTYMSADIVKRTPHIFTGEEYRSILEDLTELVGDSGPVTITQQLRIIQRMFRSYQFLKSRRSNFLSFF